MPRQWFKRRIRPITVLMVALAYLPSCVGWHTLPSTTTAPSPQPIPSLRITLRDGVRFELKRARVVGDSLVGEEAVGPTIARKAVAIQDIQMLEDRRVSTDNTAGLFAVIILVVGGALIAVASSFGSSITGCFPFCGG